MEDAADEEGRHSSEASINASRRALANTLDHLGYDVVE